MKIKERVLILCVSLILLGAGVGVIYRFALGEDEWRPSDIYNRVGGSSYSVVSGGHNSSDGLAVSLVSGMRSSRRVSAPAFTSARSGNTSASATQSAAVAGGALYATSSASYRSFGGGMSSGSGASGMGAVQASHAASQSAGGALSVSLPSAFSASTRGMIAANQSAVAAVDMSAQTDYASAAGGGARAISGRKNAVPGLGNTWDVWLGGLGTEDGFLYWDEDGNRYYDMDLLHQAFDEAKKNGQLPGWTWEDFLAQFFDPSTKHNVPVGEAWALLVMALGYALAMIIKILTKKCKTAPVA
jgi:hypothetical protein